MKNRKNIEIGALGEDIALKFLEDKGYFFLDKNYRKSWGEIDLIFKKGEIIHFIEVKSVKNVYDSLQMPEENVHEKKLKRLSRTIQSYLSEKNEEETDWQLDVIAVFLNLEKKTAEIRMTENVFA